MKREKLEKFLSKQVKVVLFDGDTYEGELHKTGEQAYKHNPNLYIPRNYYFVEPQERYTVFKCSHVVKIS